MKKKKLLFDTHTFLWLDSNPEKLSPVALAACEDSDNELYLSVISVWEIMIKTKIHRLQLQVPIKELVSVGCVPRTFRSLLLKRNNVTVGWVSFAEPNISF